MTIPDTARSLFGEEIDFWWYNSLVSFGGGVNSTALVILLAEHGWHGPIVFADTGCEWPETYCYMDYFEREFLASRGLSITRISGMPYQRKSKGKSLIEYCETANVIPMAAVRWCTMEWKVEPLRRWAEERHLHPQLIGIAADESQRMPDRWRPLVDAHIGREDCIRIIQKAGLNVPQKSGCYICPFQPDAQWRALHDRHPELYERAAGIEEGCQRVSTDRYRATIDPNGKHTLRELAVTFETQGSLLDEHDWNRLMRFQPCQCTV